MDCIFDFLYIGIMIFLKKLNQRRLWIGFMECFLECFMECLIVLDCF
jgi:hypothetical protein